MSGWAYLDHPGPIPFAHRGGASEHPENTMPAFEHAVRLGYRYVETDAHATADGVLLAFHDPVLDRVTDRHGIIAALPWETVRKARLGGERIPLMEELLTTWPDVRFRMYPGGLAQLVEGWTKNISSGAASVRPTTALLVAAWLAAVTTGALAPVGVVAGGVEVAWSAAVYVAVALQLWWMLRRLGSFGWPTAALFPVPLVFFLAVFARSALLTLLRRRVRWRGRDVAVGPRRGSR